MTIVSITNSFAMEQPGRLFNRAPVLDDHYRQRRKLRQVNSYHDLADIPTVPINSDMKGSCGAKITTSPKSVTDIKKLDLSVVSPCDSVGVDINLYFPDSSDDEDDEDELFRMQKEHRQKQHLEACHLQSSTRTPLTSSFLAPISEERHVTFASQHVVMRVDGEEDQYGEGSSSIDQRFVHEVFDAVRVKFIPHHIEFDPVTRSCLWYTPAEMESMKEEASVFRQSERRKRRNEITKQQQQRFETELDTCSLFPSLPLGIYHQAKPCSENQEDGACSSTNDVDTLSSSERRVLYESMVDAILLEQYEQKRMCLRVYGRVDEGFSGILDPCRLANVCTFAGDTKRSHERAVAKAMRALSMNDLEDNESEETEEFSRNTATVSGDKATQRRRHNTKTLKRTRSFTSSLKVETSGCLDKTIGAIFEVLLSPFLDLRKGDLFLDIGEELSFEV